MSKRYRQQKRKRSSGNADEKESLLITESYFEICPHCGEGAFIVFPSGRRTQEFFSWKSGHWLVMFMEKQGLISVEESGQLHACIDSSPLAAEDPQFDGAFVAENAVDGDNDDEDDNTNTAEWMHPKWIN